MSSLHLGIDRIAMLQRYEGPATPICGSTLAIIRTHMWVLRFAWLLRFVEHVIFPNNGSYILWTQLLEAFRRAIWNLLRVLGLLLAAEGRHSPWGNASPAAAVLFG